MPNSLRSSNASAPCRLEWRPSRWLIVALFALGILAALAVLTCEMPMPCAIPLAIGAIGQGIWSARREARRPRYWLVIAPTGQATLDGQALAAWSVQWRGPLAFLRYREASGQRGRLCWWPDTLPSPARRELRLAVPVQGDARSHASMAS
ncbi:hypothetical protein [Lysobacter panacisoli]|uniref:Toxin CptA n=1 Tax=Lysobacter panacisoli TaxID=1255263 RepID=A0ABP9LDV5_9GAMM|nr:hypothetical protein [Lysobacter panacisoli]